MTLKRIALLLLLVPSLALAQGLTPLAPGATGLTDDRPPCTCGEWGMEITPQCRVIYPTAWACRMEMKDGKPIQVCRLQCPKPVMEVS